MMRVACVAPYVPYDGIPHAGGAFLHRYLSALATEHQIDLIAPATEENRLAPGHTPGIAVHLVPCAEKPLTRLGKRWWNVRNFARALTPGWQILQAYQQDGTAQQLLRDAEIVELQWGQMLALIDALPWLSGHRLVAVEHDVVSQSFRRFAATAGLSRRALYGSLARRSGRREVRALNRCEFVRVLSNKDRDLLVSIGVTSPIDVVGPYVDVPTRDSVPGRAGPVASIGALWRRENVDGLLWFLREAWPLVRAEEPDAVIVITGAKPTPELQAMNGHTGIAIEGYQSSLQPAFERAGIFVAPLRQGAGIKIKVLQAMMCALPVVTTSVGAEGIFDEAPADAMACVADEPQELAAAIVRLIRDQERRRAIAEVSSRWARERFDPIKVDEDVCGLYRRLSQRRDARDLSK